jgi:2-iminoacetate synthase
MFKLPSFPELKEQLDNCTAKDVEKALNSTKRSLDDLCALLSPAADNQLQRMASLSQRITLQRFGKAIQLYAPIYLSNYCTNNCAYCGFSASNPIHRRCLSYAEAEAEAEVLLSRGFNHILLVSGESEKILGVEYLEEITRRLRQKFAAISIEVQPLSLDEYKRLFKAGITAVAVYQETYDCELYPTFHLTGKKCDYDYRLDTPRRVCEAGMREVGIGALLGLSDWRTEGLALGHHLTALRTEYWQTGFTVSFPRLRPAAGEFEPLHIVTERNMSHLMFALRIFDPDVGLILSTREEPTFRDGMLGLAPTRFSAGSCTAPGGYCNPEHDGEQFSVGDHRSLEEVSEMIRNKHFDPVCKDWDSTFQVEKA